MSYYSDRAAAYNHSGISSIGKTRTMINAFGGINSKKTAQPNEAREDINITTAEYPALATCGERGYMLFKEDDERIKHVTYSMIADAVIADGKMTLATENGHILQDNYMRDIGRVNVKQIVPMGKKLYAVPAGIELDGDTVTKTNVRLNNDFVITIYDSYDKQLNYVRGGEQPAAPMIGEVWYDTANDELKEWVGFWKPVEDYSEFIVGLSNQPAHYLPGLYYAISSVHGIYRYNEIKAQAEAVSTYYICIKDNTNQQRFKKLSKGNAIVIGGSDLINVKGTFTIEHIGNDGAYIVIDSLIDPDEMGLRSDMTIERRMPVLDYVIENDNRLWGCRYGNNDKGEFVNEIYACALGDPHSWLNFSGLVADSFVASVGSSGKFTGVAVLNNKIIFFKEDHYFVVSGNMPSNYTVTKVDAPGVQEGCSRSIVKINGNLYYKSLRGIMRLSANSLPVKISDAIGPDKWSNARAGTDGERYYIQMTADEDEMYVYDTNLNIWHREKAIDDFVFFLPHRTGGICLCSYKIDEGYENDFVFLDIKRTKKQEIPIVPHGTSTKIDTEIKKADREYFNYETGLFGMSDPDNKIVDNIDIRAYVADGAELRIDIEYDDNGNWKPLAVTNKEGTGSYRYKNSLKNCDCYRLAFHGYGEVVIYSVTIGYRNGGDR